MHWKRGRGLGTMARPWQLAGHAKTNEEIQLGARCGSPPMRKQEQTAHGWPTNRQQCETSQIYRQLESR